MEIPVVEFEISLLLEGGLRRVPLNYSFISNEKALSSAPFAFETLIIIIRQAGRVRRRKPRKMSSFYSSQSL